MKLVKEKKVKILSIFPELWDCHNIMTLSHWLSFLNSCSFGIWCLMSLFTLDLNFSLPPSLCTAVRRLYLHLFGLLFCSPFPFLTSCPLSPSSCLFNLPSPPDAVGIAICRCKYQKLVFRNLLETLSMLQETTAHWNFCKSGKRYLVPSSELQT